jgi:hypothetical protein
MLCGGQQEGLGQRFIPGCKQLPRDPGMHGLTDSDDIGALRAKQHFRFLTFVR